MECAEKGTMEKEIREYIVEEVRDWDDEVVGRVRFKDFSGQRSDWEGVYGFWRELILRISRRFDILLFRPSELRNGWFSRGGLSPLCLGTVLVVMRSEGDIVRLQDLHDSAASSVSAISALSMILRKVGNLMMPTRSNDDDDDDHLLAVVPVLEDRAARVLRRLTETVVTMPTFDRLCSTGDDDTSSSSSSSLVSSAILSHLCAQRKARRVSFRRIQGVKISLSTSPVSAASPLDAHLLHLISTSEMLQQHLSLLHRRSLKSKKSALASLNSGDKNLALRHMRAFKLADESIHKCDNLLNRVDQVLNIIATAESTKMVSEAIQIGAQAIKENKISAEEVERNLQQLDESIDLQKQVENALESASSYTCVDDEDIEDEFKKLELEIEGHQPTLEAEASYPADSLSVAFSNLKVADGSSSTHIAAKETKHVELEAA